MLDVDALGGHHLDAFVGVPSTGDAGESLLPSDVSRFSKTCSFRHSLCGAYGGYVGAPSLGISAGSSVPSKLQYSKTLVVNLDAKGAGAVVWGDVVGPEGLRVRGCGRLHL